MFLSVISSHSDTGLVVVVDDDGDGVSRDRVSSNILTSL